MEIQQHRSFKTVGILTAVLLGAAFILPVIIPYPGNLNVNFLNIESLWSRLSIWMKIYMVWPLVGCILAIFATRQPNYVVRGIMFLAIGFMPFLLSLIGLSEQMLAPGPFGMGGMMGGMAAVSIVLYMVVLGFIGMTVGAFVGDAYKDNKVAPFFALGGGALYLLALIVPIRLGYETGVILTAPFSIMGEMPLMGFVMLVCMVILGLGAVYSIIWGINHRNGMHGGRLLKVLLGVAFAVAFLALITASLFNALDEGRGQVVGLLLSVLFGFVKVLGTMGGFFLAKCLGLMEFVAYSNPPARTPAAEHVKGLEE